MIPTRRDLRFKLTPESVKNWHAKGRYVTQFANAMSIFFPDGERYFIHTLRHYRGQISDPSMQAAITAFIGQEAMHGREHEDYNRLLDDAGLPANELQSQAARFLDLLKATLPPSAQLSVTIAQEHFTAIISELVLTDPTILEGADTRLKALWHWHALEETEHKAVAFDVYEQAVGKGLGAYALRTGSMTLTTIGFLGITLYFQWRLLQADGCTSRWKGFGEFARFMLGSPGLLRKLGRPWLDYFRPGFHPWDHDNRHLLAELDALVTGVNERAVDQRAETEMEYARAA